MQSYCEWCHQGASQSAPPMQSPTVEPSTFQPTLACEQCRTPVTLVDVTEACAIVHKSRKTIHQWIKRGWVNTVRLADGRKLICYSSLFLPAREEASEEGKN